MRSFKSVFALAVVAAMSGAAMADSAVTVSGDVHSASSLEFRGLRASAGDATFGAAVKVAHVSGAYGTVSVDSAKSNGLGASLSELSAGYARDLGNGITGDVGVTRHMLSGQTGSANFNFNEIYLGAKWNGVYGKASLNVGGNEGGDARVARGTLYTEVGYDYAVTPQVTVGAGLGFYALSSDAVAKQPGAADSISSVTVHGSYAVDSRLSLAAEYQTNAGSDQFGNRANANDQFRFGVNYKF